MWKSPFLPQNFVKNELSNKIQWNFISMLCFALLRIIETAICFGAVNIILFITN